ncbi:hypothetical protein FocTR4_00007550 [Fusarium oxysporum f. sp. cubense]|uniref:Enoyl reductase (ER) domain-containing protein n=1 Tax=Fusarium oxysporum f. sp. cubense TaxID=61366 RepID=A0A5C6TKF1_FUSOC|nr:hypothetical protein FocTR4_00007550 [Fusarium oxysporum f. sp. cubense]
MKEAIVSRGPKVHIIESEIPKPGPGQVVVKIEYAGSNPKDWKRPEYWGSKASINQGDDHAGVVHEVGEGVSDFKIGDRVAAMHEGKQPGGSYAEYGVSWAYTTIHLPEHTSFQAVGSYAVQLAKKSNIHPLICVAGRAQDHVERMIDRSRGDTVIDYRKGRATVAQEIKASLRGEKLEYAFDAVSEMGSYQTICDVLNHQTGKITLIIPAQSYSDIPKTIEKSVTTVASVHEDLKVFARALSIYFGRGLEDGWFKAHPQEVVPGGLGGIEKGLTNLKNGKASAVKYVYKIADTPGIEPP